jgi:two-component system response regulator FlrC
MSKPRVLIVEDDVSLREALSDTLQLAGYSVFSVAGGNAALNILENEKVDIVVSDVQMTPMDGHTLLKGIKKNHGALPVILITAYGTIQKAVEAMHDGAADYLVKPFDVDALISLIERYVSSPLDNEVGLVAEDPRTLHLVELTRRVADTDATVMIGGESGTGKEVFARYIHNNSKRAKGPFVAINCAAIPENMLEALLFGYEKGAFTGAYQATPGKFEQANGGTLLLDEISEMNLGLQAKLLRILQEREVERLGGRKVIPLDVRVLATSNRVMREEVDAGRFREDLYYRLHVFPINLHPLRDRKQDILPLSYFLLQRHAGGQACTELTEVAKARLLEHSWPGNIRELDNVMQRALILKRGNKIDAEDLSFESANARIEDKQGKIIELPDQPNDLCDELRKSEQRLIIEALQAGNGNRKYAAMKLGISQRTLRYKLARMRDEGVEIPRGYGVRVV